MKVSGITSGLMAALPRKSLAGMLVTLVLFLRLPASGAWSPPPESQRFGPMAFDSRISRPLNSLISDTASRPTDFSVRLIFSQEKRPTEFAYLLSTANGFGRGVKLASDLYGNIFLSIGRPSDAAYDYQLIKISGPLEIGTESTVEVQISTVTASVKVRLNGQSVPISEARPNLYFDKDQMFLNVSNLELGGSDERNFSGVIRDAVIVFGTARVSVDSLALKLTGAILVWAWAMFLVGRMPRRVSTP
ncbi:MAG: hypothetical protein EBU84_00665 [Actinobacteria bacterium]|nr:hypothetical protein [Actinomycetota bacterium]